MKLSGSTAAPPSGDVGTSAVPTLAPPVPYTGPTAPAATPSAPTSKGNPFGHSKPVAPGFSQQPASRNYPELDGDGEFDDVFGVKTPEQKGSRVPAIKPAEEPPVEGDTEFDANNVSFVKKTEEDTEDDENADLPDDGEEAVPEQPGQPRKRNYAEFDEEAAKVLRKFPNALFDRFGKQINDWKLAANKVKDVEAQMEKLKSEDKTPKYLAEHPDAYQLHPGYSEIAQTFRDAQFETDHWRQQLVAIKNGEAWSELKGYRQDGSPVIEEHPGREDGRIDTDAEITVSQYLNTAMGIGMQARQKAQQFVGQYQQFQKTAYQELQESKSKFFPDMDHKKFDAAEKKMWQAAYDCVPVAYQNHPLAEIIPYSFVAIQRLANYTQSLEKKLGLKKQARSVGPKNLPSAAGKLPAGVIDMDKYFEESDS